MMLSGTEAFSPAISTHSLAANSPPAVTLVHSLPPSTLIDVYKRAHPSPFR